MHTVSDLWQQMLADPAHAVEAKLKIAGVEYGENKIVRKSLSETLKENRTRCKMTQEFVAETIGVSRQAVSKWENGTSEPNTSNLMALARLYGIPAEDLLKGVESALEAQEK